MAQLMKRLIGCRDMGTWIIIVALGCGLVAAIREALTARALTAEVREELKVTLAVYRSVEDEKNRIASALDKALNAADQPRYAVDDRIALLDSSHAREEVEKDKFVASERLKELLEEGYEVHIVSSRPQFLPETADKCLFDLLPERNFWCCDQGLSFEGGLRSPAQVDVWVRALNGIDYGGDNAVNLRVDLRLRPDGFHRSGQVGIQEEARRHGIVVNNR